MAVEARWYAGRLLPLAASPAERRVPLTPKADYGEFLAGRAGAHRTVCFGRRTVNYGWGAGMGLRLVTGFDAYNLRHYQDYMDLVRFGEPQGAGARVWTDVEGVRRWDLLSALSARYLISPVASPNPEFRTLARFERQPAFAFYRGMATTDLYVIENPFARGRAFWCDEVVGVSDEGAMREAVRERRGLRVAVALGAASSKASAPALPQSGVEVVEARDGVLRLSLDTPGGEARYLVLSEIWHPGWRATLDGRPVALHRTHLALMGLHIPPGRHTLTVAFRPLHWERALAVTGVAALVLLAVAGTLLYAVLRGARARAR